MGKGPKTKKSVMKRFKVTGTGKIMVKKVAGRSHLLAHKSQKKKRHMKRQPILHSTAAKSIKTMMNI